MKSSSVIAIGALVLVLVGIASPAARRQQRALDPTAVCTPDPSWGTLHQELVPDLLARVNAHRAALGIGRLAISPELTASAVWKARHMAAYTYLDVDDPAPPVKRTFLDRLTACGYSGLIAFENIAEGYPDAESVTQAWLNDPESRASIDHPGFGITGIAAAMSASGVLYWVEEFGAAPAPPATDSRCHVPSLVGKTLVAAKRALGRAHCTLGTVVRVRWRHVRRGRVIAQAPHSGQTLKPRGKVDLIVSSGRRRA